MIIYQYALWYRHLQPMAASDVGLFEAEYASCLWRVGEWPGPGGCFITSRPHCDCCDKYYNQYLLPARLELATCALLWCGNKNIKKIQ